jgi:hypothetical protein
MGSNEELNLIQLSDAPLIIAPSMRRIIGDVKLIVESLVYWNGRELEEFQITEIINRIVYLVVRIVAEKKRIRINRFKGLYRDISRIRSLE